MKIRIKGNSLRYRLSKTDINTLAEKGYLAEYTDFGPVKFAYAITKADVPHLSATFHEHTITLQMPADMLSQWCNTDVIGFEYNDNGMYLLAEKDFQCLDNVAEDQSDNYPNPLAKNC